MLRKAGIALAGVIALVPILRTAAADEKTPSIKEIMKTVASSKAEKGLCAKCADAGKSANWDEAQKLAKTLTEQEQAIADELIAIQGSPVDLGGYYQPDPAKAAAAMRPSRAFNEALASLG